MTETLSPKELLSDPKKGLHRAQGVLCYLFRHVLLWRSVDNFSWQRRLNMYFEREHNKKNPDKGNLNKTLCNDDMTWGSFKKAIDFLNPISSVFIIRLTWRNGRVSEYPIVIDVTEKEDEIGEYDGNKGSSPVFEEQKKAVGTLARLFRGIVLKEGIDRNRWNALLDEYADNPINGIPKDRSQRNTEITAIQRQVLMDRLSWNNFRRGILVLNPEKEEYILRLRWTNDDPAKDPNALTEHTVTIRDPFAPGKRLHDKQ